MAKITTAHSMSLDGFIAGPDGGAAAAGLHDWLTAGDTPSRANPGFMMARPSAEFFDEGVSRCGAVIAGRRTYDLARAWGGRGPIPGLPLFVVTHRVPGPVPPGQPPYTFVTTGIQDAAAQAATAAAGRDAAQGIQRILPPYPRLLPRWQQRPPALPVRRRPHHAKRHLS